MINFTYYNPAKIIFGRNTEQEVSVEVAKYGKKVLLHYGGGTIKKIGVYDKVVNALKAQGIEFIELGGVMPNPKLSLIQEGIKLCREHQVDFILAVGGGSTIDSAKAIAVGVPYEGDVWDFYMNGMQAKEALPIGVILTIPAAGSESSDSSVVTKEEGELKRYYGTHLMIPKFAILNPETTCYLPDYQTACGASDIIAHLMERYFTQVDHVDFTDRMIEATLKTMFSYAPLALLEPQNYDYRAEIMWAGTIAHNNLLNTGRIGDWASHDIEHEISGIYDIAHGAGLSIVFPAWMKYVYNENQDRFVQFATRVMNVDFAMDQKEMIIEEGIRRLESFYVKLGLPVRLSDIDIHEDRLQEMADKTVLGRGTVGNFKKLTADDVYEILKLAL
ncbi:iron-containing alcohol dehydrogenase [Cellulosilyticum sp. I15G10I2]|uniref:iron-containing alcohol dehydrogenase n=1 Tax=Cellulosilyticum sp. I15G10I2 TaxID=1892843 RepID=UPI00085CC767|nr:iron-containing alcohol dehydrogenase [Cellulosilyticum sp. I15G10I2]